MKYIKSLLFALFCIALVISCSDDHYVEIDSLSVAGDEFYCNQKVKLWMVVRSDDLMEVDYEWGCDGGRITQPQGLDENTWQAPNVTGTYTVWCKTTAGGKSETRYHTMNVSTYFFEKFEKLPFGFAVQDKDAVINFKTETVNGDVNGYAEFKGNSTQYAYRYLRKNFDDPELKLPFSTLATIGFTNAIPQDTLTVGKAKGPHSLYYAWGFKRDSKKTDPVYPTELRFEWYPNKDGKIPSITSGVTGEKISFNSTIQINYLDNGVAKNIRLYLTIDKLSSFSNQVYKKVSLSIDQNYLIHINLDGEELYTSNYLQEFRRDFNCIDEIYVDWWRIGFPIGASKELPVLYLDDAYAANDGTILK